MIDLTGISHSVGNWDVAKNGLILLAKREVPRKNFFKKEASNNKRKTREVAVNGGWKGPTSQASNGCFSKGGLATQRFYISYNNVNTKKKGIFNLPEISATSVYWSSTRKLWFPIYYMKKSLTKCGFSVVGGFLCFPLFFLDMKMKRNRLLFSLHKKRRKKLKTLLHNACGYIT